MRIVLFDASIILRQIRGMEKTTSLKHTDHRNYRLLAMAMAKMPCAAAMPERAAPSMKPCQL